MIRLAAPARVSPAPTTEHEQHQKNNQYGFHCYTSLVKGSWTDLYNGPSHFSTTFHAMSSEDARLSTLDHFKRSIRMAHHLAKLIVRTVRFRPDESVIPSLRSIYRAVPKRNLLATWKRKHYDPWNQEANTHAA